MFRVVHADTRYAVAILSPVDYMWNALVKISQIYFEEELTDSYCCTPVSSVTLASMTLTELTVHHCIGYQVKKYRRVGEAKF